MILHVFNPEHDLALACNRPNFTPPVAARRLYRDLGFLPALWAARGDAVLVEDKSAAARLCAAALAAARDAVGRDVPPASEVAFVEAADLSRLPLGGVDVWGWDVTVRERLLRCGVAEDVLPDTHYIYGVRGLSHRRHAADLLRKLRMEGTVGESSVCGTMDEVCALLDTHRNVVVKAPWSGCGRGIRFLMGGMTDHQRGWIKNTLAAQGNVVVEPYYDKRSDFAMEFVSDGRGTVSYVGLSLFDTDNWAYTGSLLATERLKARRMARHLPEELLGRVRDAICRHLGALFDGRYRGAFGVDMMVVGDGTADGCLLHPCVEINLRRTMGHVALALSPEDDARQGLMRIEFTENQYQLKLKSL